MLQSPLPHTFLRVSIFNMNDLYDTGKPWSLKKKKFIMKDNWVELHFNYLPRQERKPKIGN